MARPKAKVLICINDEVNKRKREVLEAEDIYGVFYNGTPISVRDYRNPNFDGYVNVDGKQETSKYKRLYFPHKASALNSARKLNEAFHTDKFEVFRLGAMQKVD